MTLAIGIQHRGFVDMWADTRLSGGQHGIQIAPKIFNAHGSVYAFSGDADIDSLFVAISTPKRKKPDDFIRWFNREFATVLEDTRKTLGDSYSFDCVISDKGKLFGMQGVTIFSPSTKYICIGSGAPAAYGILQYLDYIGKPITERVLLDVFRSVAKHNESVAYPVDRWICSEDGSIQTSRYES